MAGAIPLDQAERAARQRPSVEGAADAWRTWNRPTHAPSLADRPVPAREWAVDGLVPFRAVTLFSGDGGTGKSTLALQLACASVLGQRWLGRDTRPGKAFYLSCEDDLAELHRRLASICQAEDWGLADLDGLELFDRTGAENAVIARGEGYGAGWEPSQFWVQMSAWITDEAPGLVVLDSLYDFFPGNQLDQASARYFMGTLRSLAYDSGCAIVVLWHPSKSGMESGDGTSGNVAFRNAARAMLYLEKSDKEDRDSPLILRGKKSNYGPNGDELRIKWDQGRFVPVLPEGDGSPVPAAIAKVCAESAFLAALDAATRQGRHVSHSKNGGAYAPKTFLRMPQCAGFKLNDLERAMERHFSAGTIEVGEVGHYVNRTPKMGIRRTVTATEQHENTDEIGGGDHG